MWDVCGKPSEPSGMVEVSWWCMFYLVTQKGIFFFNFCSILNRFKETIKYNSEIVVQVNVKHEWIGIQSQYTSKCRNI